MSNPRKPDDSDTRDDSSVYEDDSQFSDSKGSYHYLDVVLNDSDSEDKNSDLEQSSTTHRIHSLLNANPRPENDDFVILVPKKKNEVLVSRHGHEYEIMRTLTDADKKRLFEQTRLDLSGKEKGKLGKGAFGSVFVAKNKATGEYVAVKKIKNQFLEKFKSENDFHDLLKSKKIDGLMLAFDKIEAQADSEPEYQVMSLATFGDGSKLSTLLPRLNPEAQNKLITFTAYELSRIFADMHANGVYHLDFKNDNFLILLEPKKDSTRHIYVSDFGASVSFEEDNTSLHKAALTVSADPCYMPPEFEETFVNRQDKPRVIDEWRLGLTLLSLVSPQAEIFVKTEMLHKVVELATDTTPLVMDIHPKEYYENQDLQDKLTRLLNHPNVTPVLAGYIKGLLNPDWAKRASVKEGVTLLESDVITDANEIRSLFSLLQLANMAENLSAESNDKRLAAPDTSFYEAQEESSPNEKSPPTARGHKL